MGHGFFIAAVGNISKINMFNQSKTKMKTGKIFRIFMVIGLLAMASPAYCEAYTAAPTETADQRVAHLQNRLDEIRAMDSKKLTREEKKALRGEVKAIKKEMAEISGGVYLSVGAIILIALLLILLL
jgi:hypothetical protein